MKKFRRLASLFTVAVMLFAGLSSTLSISAAEEYNETYFRYPTEAVFEAFGGPGYAYGELTVKVNTWINNNDGGCPTDAVVYWANENGRLEGYSPLVRFKLSTRSTSFAFPEIQAIPEGADRMLVYTSIHGTEKLSTQSVEAMLPEGYDYVPAGDPIMSFVVLSDTHIKNSDSEVSNTNFRDMLSDVKELFPDVKGIFFNGDNVQSNKNASVTTDLKNQLAKLESYRSSICPDIPIYMGVGNHDLWPYAKYAEAKEVFLQAATLPDGSHPTSLNYDFWLNGFHFIFLGDDDGAKPDPTYATLSEETLEWLDETLAQDYDSMIPTFIFMHQGLSNTVAGTITDYGEEWDGVVNAAEVKKVLRKYPEAILFSGHSHYTMDSFGNAFVGGQFFPTAFNTAALKGTGDNEGEAQGYIIEVYDDCVYVRGRDFKANVWKGSAQYVVDYSGESDGPSFIPTPKPNEKPNSTDANATDAPSGETDKPTSDASDVAPAEDKGCGAAAGIGAIALTLVPMACLTFKRRKEDN